MGRYGAPKRVRHIAGELPDDLVHVIFSKLDFKSKVVAGQVCRSWDQLLKAPIAGARHWNVHYNIDKIVSSQASVTAEQQQVTATVGRCAIVPTPCLTARIVEKQLHLSPATCSTGSPLHCRWLAAVRICQVWWSCRWLINRAAVIKVVRVSATLSSEPEGIATMKLLESQLLLLAGCLAAYANRLELVFHDASPFASPLLSNSAFLTFLCPMVKSLYLCCMEVTITASQFAAICELSSLEELHISEMTVSSLVKMGNSAAKRFNWEVDLCYINRLGAVKTRMVFAIGIVHQMHGKWMQEEVTSDISKLVNLRTLELHGIESLESLPESISCLQKLEVLCIRYCPITEMPSGLGMLASLSSLVILYAEWRLRIPPSLPGLKSLVSVDFEGCSLTTIPEGLADLSALTVLKLSLNHFESSDGRSWWPTTLSRLTRLAELDLAGSDIVSLPPHISGLRQLTKLEIQCNDLRSLPEQLSSLQNLRHLQAGSNHLRTVLSLSSAA